MIKHTVDDDWLVEQYVGKNRSSRDIGKEAKYSPGAVTNRLKQLGVTIRVGGQKTNANMEMLRDHDTLYRMRITEGLSIKEIINIVGCSEAAVNRYVKKHGIKADVGFLRLSNESKRMIRDKD